MSNRLAGIVTQPAPTSIASNTQDRIWVAADSLLIICMLTFY